MREVKFAQNRSVQRQSGVWFIRDGAGGQEGRRQGVVQQG